MRRIYIYNYFCFDAFITQIELLFIALLEESQTNISSVSFLSLNGPTSSTYLSHDLQQKDYASCFDLSWALLPFSLYLFSAIGDTYVKDGRTTN